MKTIILNEDLDESQIVGTWLVQAKMHPENIFYYLTIYSKNGNYYRRICDGKRVVEAPSHENDQVLVKKESKYYFKDSSFGTHCTIKNDSVHFYDDEGEILTHSTSRIDNKPRVEMG